MGEKIEVLDHVRLPAGSFWSKDWLFLPECMTQAKHSGKGLRLEPDKLKDWVGIKANQEGAMVCRHTRRVGEAQGLVMSSVFTTQGFVGLLLPEVSEGNREDDTPWNILDRFTAKGLGPVKRYRVPLGSGVQQLDGKGLMDEGFVADVDIAEAIERALRSPVAEDLKEALASAVTANVNAVQRKVRMVRPKGHGLVFMHGVEPEPTGGRRVEDFSFQVQPVFDPARVET